MVFLKAVTRMSMKEATLILNIEQNCEGFISNCGWRAKWSPRIHQFFEDQWMAAGAAFGSKFVYIQA